MIIGQRGCFRGQVGQRSSERMSMATRKPSGEAGLAREARVSREMQGRRYLLALG